LSPPAPGSISTTALVPRRRLPSEFHSLILVLSLLHASLPVQVPENPASHQGTLDLNLLHHRALRLSHATPAAQQLTLFLCFSNSSSLPCFCSTQAVLVGWSSYPSLARRLPTRDPVIDLPFIIPEQPYPVGSQGRAQETSCITLFPHPGRASRWNRTASLC
jgi:hypothetical protein